MGQAGDVRFLRSGAPGRQRAHQGRVGPAGKAGRRSNGKTAGACGARASGLVSRAPGRLGSAPPGRSMIPKSGLRFSERSCSRDDFWVFDTPRDPERPQSATPDRRRRGCDARDYEPEPEKSPPAERRQASRIVRRDARRALPRGAPHGRASRRSAPLGFRPRARVMGKARARDARRGDRACPAAQRISIAAGAWPCAWRCAWACARPTFSPQSGEQ